MSKDYCFLISKLKIVIVYIYPIDGAGGFRDKAAQFVNTYQQYPPDLEHATVVICNGAPVTSDAMTLFAPMPGCSFRQHDNSGMDIGGYQLAARTAACDLMVFFGAHTYFKKPGWLVKMRDAFLTGGDTLYGATGNQGDMRFNVYPHVRTTAFWCSPNLINRHPLRASHNGLRYEYEHGASGLTTWLIRQCGGQPWIVAWDGMYPLTQCDSIPNGFHQGNQSNVLVGDRLTAPPYYHTP